MYLAYLDPSSGSMLAAVLVAGFAGVAVTVRVWWRKGTAKLRRREPADAAAQAGSEQAGSPVQEG